ncbi:hypothetical protein F0562_027617 [Nyssa sinensis]|uniref:Receptor-like serine/threonine-protein kinase n=1 Tax=Nyssa sinensis TaxID=561372 RepID=A0A5J5B3M9_9ASTE|nr:hypothetical protein F0562_027617 [Nyssa sinensis]
MSTPKISDFQSVVYGDNSLNCLHLLYSDFLKTNSLNGGSSLSVEKPNDILISPDGVFSAGFHSIGDNAYWFAIWFSEPLYDGNHTIVWMANREEPVNGRLSKLSLLKTGNLVLIDAGRLTLWATDTASISSVQLLLYNTGNLVLRTSEDEILWQSFDSPTDTLLPQQLFTRDTKLVSSRSLSNYSSGFYKLFFDNDNLLRLQYDDRKISSLYWPDPWLPPWDAGRSGYNNSRIAELDSLGYFHSSDDLQFTSANLGIGPKRRLTLDVDGNLRLYSLNEMKRTWVVSWQAFSNPCMIHGICGPNSLCTYVPHKKSGRMCNCIPRHTMRNDTDHSYGCVPDFNLSLKEGEVEFVQLRHVEFYGYDIRKIENYTLERCEKECLQANACLGFQYKFETWNGYYSCYPKTRLLNGHRSLGFSELMYIKLPKTNLSYYKPVREFRLDCPDNSRAHELDRTYKKNEENGSLKVILWFAYGLGGFELICILSVWLYLSIRSGATTKSYLQVATGFKRFTYAELKKASRNFSAEIGKGGSGVVYKGALPNQQIAAMKRLDNANQGEAEFLAEVSTIGRLNHMNLIETLGYCAEGKHRLLVYEYMEHGSLAENLHSNTLDWEKRFNVAVGTAKGLAYLHEECLEWVLHCDVKPQNILLDSGYQPKVADFGLSKLLNRGAINNSSFSTIRGTRGYMAPEWVFNLPITSKVDVYSYGIVMLEMVTGRSPTGVHTIDDTREKDDITLVMWVRKKMHESAGNTSWIEEIVDPTVDGEYNMGRMELLVRVALLCAEEARDARPTMSKVVEMLLRSEIED